MCINIIINSEKQNLFLRLLTSIRQVDEWREKTHKKKIYEKNIIENMLFVQNHR